jgi:hypothetical protein
MPTRRYGAQQLGVGTIASKMVEPQLEGNKLVNLDFTTLWATPGA